MRHRQVEKVPTRKEPDEHQFKVGDRVSVTLHTGLLVDATVRAIVPHHTTTGRTDGVHLQVDYGKDETALVELWRVHRK
jgi:hypothetical protein